MNRIVLNRVVNENDRMIQSGDDSLIPNTQYLIPSTLIPNTQYLIPSTLIPSTNFLANPYLWHHLYVIMGVEGPV